MATNNVKYFTSFFVDHYTSYLICKHEKKWNEHQLLQTDKERNNFFEDVGVPFFNTLASHFEGDQTIRFFITSGIVDVVIGGLLFHPNTVTGVTRSQVLSICKPFIPAEDVQKDALLALDEYGVEIKIPDSQALPHSCKVRCL